MRANKVILIVLIVLIASIVINFIKSDRAFHIAKSLPFSNSQEKIDKYDWAGVAALGIIGWGIYRLYRKREEEE